MAPSIKDFKMAICNKKEPTMLYHYGQRWPCIHHARISYRIACSKLNPHLFHNHLIENPPCACGHPVEDPTHFFLNCSRYTTIRIELRNNIALISRVSMSALLYGNTESGIDENKSIFNEGDTCIRLSP